MKQPDRVTYFEELIKSNYPNLALWQLDLNGDLLYPNSKVADMFYSLFKSSGCLNLCLQHLNSYQTALTLEHPDSYCRPIMLTDMFDLVWIAVFAQKESQVNSIYVIGPALVSETSKAKLVQALTRHNFSKELNNRVHAIFDQIPRIPVTTMYMYSSMLYFTLNGSPLPDYLPVTASSNDTSHTESINQANYRSSFIHWQQQEILMKNIEEGNLNYQDSLNLIVRNASVPTQKMLSALRQTKNTLIAFISLCCEAGIRGGLSPATSFYMKDTYISQVETATTQAQLVELNHTMYDNYIQCVHEKKAQSGYSSAIRSCCDYISLHICEKITISDLAANVGYTDYYLSRKFKEETGYNLLSYICKQRIEYAKKLLTTTSYSTQEISDRLQFCSRSYFTDMFKRHTGMLPKEYREKYTHI